MEYLRVSRSKVTCEIRSVLGRSNIKAKDTTAAAIIGGLHNRIRAIMRKAAAAGKGIKHPEKSAKKELKESEIQNSMLDDLSCRVKNLDSEIAILQAERADAIARLKDYVNSMT